MCLSLELRKMDKVYLPLIKKFYKDHYNASKPKSSDLSYGLYQEGMLLGLIRFKPINQNYLLLGMAIHKDYRKQGLGGVLLSRSLNEIPSKPCYCFALSHLTSFYGSHFDQLEPENLPKELSLLFKRYSDNGKELIAMTLR